MKADVKKKFGNGENYKMIKEAKILNVVKKDVRLFILAGILSIIISFLNISLINFERKISDTILTMNRNLFREIVFIVVVIVVLKIFLEYIKSYTFGRFAEKTLANLRIVIGEKLLKVPIEYIENNSTGDFISRLSNDLSLIQNFIGGSLNDLLYHPVTFIMGVILALNISWKLTLFCFTVIPIILFLSVIISSPIEKFTQKQQDAFGDVNTLAQDSISGIAVIKSFNLQKEIHNRFVKELQKAFKEGLRSARYEVVLEPIKMMLQIGPFLLMFFYGGSLVLKGEMTVGGILAFIELLNVFLASVNVFPNIISNYRKAKAAGERIEEILNQEEESFGEIEEGIKDYPYAVEFENVSFSYNGNMVIRKY
ncbi:MAG: hypothetical protein CBR30_02015 [Dictyoglomus sp. NZ13-RE01]|nr:MAG: hypothetical protein CBR30_02015 [Dictyoglomus sp. NZ13-RE01]